MHSLVAPGPLHVSGAIVLILGASLALWCVLLFAVVGRGTPLPFDPPRLVVRGPYRLVRNPMALGVGSVVAGAGLLYESLEIGRGRGCVLPDHPPVRGPVRGTDAAPDVR